jgi:hypothetical protein
MFALYVVVVFVGIFSLGLVNVLGVLGFPVAGALTLIVLALGSFLVPLVKAS